MTADKKSTGHRHSRRAGVLTLGALAWLGASAYDMASVNADGVTLYYNDLGNNEVELTYERPHHATEGYTEAIDIPPQITVLGFDYTVTGIGDRAFAWCDRLTRVTIPQSVSRIGKNAFDGCYALETLEVSAANGALRSDGVCVYHRVDGTLLACIPSAEGEYEISDEASAIAPGAFGGCTFLTRAEIPRSVTSIGESAFYFCNFLEQVEIPATVTEIGHAAFADCLSLTDIYVDPANPVYKSDDGNLLTADGKVLLQSPGARGAQAIIPEGVEAIGDEAFMRSYGITMVDIAPTVTRVGEGAFIDSYRLASVQLPPTVSEIGTLAFAMCPALTHVYVAAADPGTIRLGEGVFAEVDKRYCTLYVPAGSEAAYAKARQWGEFTDIKGYDALKPQTIEWTETPDTIEVGSKVRLLAVSSAGLPVRYTLSPESQHAATLAGDELTIHAPGVVRVYAYQPGNVVYAPATPVAQTLYVGVSGVADSMADGIKVYGTRGAIAIRGAQPGDVARVYDVSGRLVYEGTERDIRVGEPAVYIVHISGRGYKAATR